MTEPRDNSYIRAVRTAWKRSKRTAFTSQIRHVDELPQNESISIELVEYGNLRQEINNRTTLAYALITLQLVTLGTGLSVAAKFPDIVAGLAAVSSFLWLFWVDHAGQVYKIAAYIAVELAPRLTEAAGRSVMGWEYFLRRLDGPENGAREALHMSAAGLGRVRIPASSTADKYAMLLFGCSPPVLLAGYAIEILRDHQRPILLVIAIMTAVTAVWLFSVWRFISFRRMVVSVHDAIIHRNQGNENAK